jgi:hypothetical protein
VGQRIAPSRVALGALCLYTFRDDVDLPPDKSGPAAVAGNAAHASIESFVRDGEILPALPPSFGGWWEASGLSHDTHDLTVEMPIVYNFMRGESRIVERLANGRMPPTTADEMPCAIDLVAVPHDGGTPVLFDWKTGKPKDFGWQMLTYATAFDRLSATPRDLVRADVVYVHPERTFQDALFVFDAMDLDAAEQTFRNMKRALPLAQPTPGRHCRDLWCRLRETCGARRDWEKQNRRASA